MLPQTKRIFTWLTVFASGGLLFSGYLSLTKFITETCAFSESCPYFLGYPACFYGFAMYTVMFVTLILAVMGKIGALRAATVTRAVSFLGIVFAGKFVIEELWQSRITGVLGLSTCAYGLIFYIVIFALSLKAHRMLRAGQTP